MVEFNRSLWCERAKNRHVNACTKGKNLDRANERLINDLIAINGLTTLVSWCKNQRLKVAFIATPALTYGAYRHEMMTIDVSRSASPEIQLFTLLHELGHHLSRTSQKSNKKPDRKHDRRSAIKRVNIIEEEYKAWNLGKKLAKKLKIVISWQRWEVDRARSLNSYFHWVIS